jgi:o-succinylbenzoate---CoA ligase
VKHWLHLAAEKHPDRMAVEGAAGGLTYAELLHAASAGAGALAGMGLTPGARVALALPPSEEFVIALHACALAGHPFVPVDLRWSKAERAARLGRADVVISEPLGRAGTAEFLPNSGSFSAPAGLEAPMAVMHTSGTTAAPKPVVLTRANFLASALGSAVALGLDRAERWLCPMPLTHVGGLSIPIRSAIYATTTVLHGRFDTEAVLNELMDAARRITVVSLVPTMLARLLDAGLAQPPVLRWALLGGGPIAPALLARAAEAGVPVAPTYGMTEACSQIATFGWPLVNVEVALEGHQVALEGHQVALDGHQAAQDRPAGEIAVRGPIVCRDFIDQDGWLRTGDLGRLDDRGRLEIVGRKSDTIITGGENVAPAEVEAVLLEHPDVADAGVHARPDPEWGEAVLATVVCREGAALTPDALRAFCAARLAGYKVPKEFRFAPELPRTASGKLVRHELS